MKKTDKYISTFFLWLAGIILVAHSVIPHHHHLETLASNQKCEHADASAGHNEHLNHQTQAEILFTDASAGHDNCGCNGCNFNAESTSPFSKLSIDVLAFANQTNKTIPFFIDREINHIFLTPDYLSAFFELKSLRGPPSLG